MKQKLRLSFTFIFTLAIFFVVSAQVKSVHAIIEYEPSDSETKSQAFSKAIERARQKAIEDEFGLIVAQTNFTNINNGDLHFRSIGISDLAGEWLGDTKTPVTVPIAKDGRIIIKAEVWGKARRIVSEKIPLNIHILRNTPSEEHATRVFMDYDKFYISFESPIDGHLAVYLMDDSLNYQRILPYSDSELKCYKIEGNKKYISHYYNKNGKNLPGYENFEETRDIGHMVLALGKSKEECQFYVMFSPNKFMDPEDDEAKKSYGYKRGLVLPPTVHYDHMQEWLLTNRRRDKSMQVVKVPITIIPRESY